MAPRGLAGDKETRLTSAAASRELDDLSPLPEGEVRERASSWGLALLRTTRRLAAVIARRFTAASVSGMLHRQKYQKKCDMLP